MWCYLYVLYEDCSSRLKWTWYAPGLFWSAFFIQEDSTLTATTNPERATLSSSEETHHGRLTTADGKRLGSTRVVDSTSSIWAPLPGGGWLLVLALKVTVLVTDGIDYFERDRRCELCSVTRRGWQTFLFNRFGPLSATDWGTSKFFPAEVVFLFHGDRYLISIGHCLYKSIRCAWVKQIS